MAVDELLVVGLDMNSGRETHIRERPMDQWRRLGYGRLESVVCAACFYGLDGVAEGTRVPLIARGRIGGSRRPHFAHPPHMGPPGGHHPETLWHIQAKLRLERWALSLPNVVEARQERWIPTRERRTDVHVRLASGSRLALEAQSDLMTDQLWQDRHRDYATAGIQDVWFMRPGAAVPHVLLAEQAQVYVLDLGERTVRVMWGQPHPRSGRWWEARDLTHFALHHPPCPGDDIHQESVTLAELGLNERGLVLPERLADKLAGEHRTARRSADSARAEAEENRRRAARAVRSSRPPVAREAVLPSTRRSARPGTPRRPRCAVCGGQLGDVLVPYGAHIAVRGGGGWTDCLGRPCTVRPPLPSLVMPKSAVRDAQSSVRRPAESSTRRGTI
ncbi:competence protein CoiA family protein [Streptomyces niveus]|uniref:competence protein CoiA family protein n=1 Tax=Streptomyces niveus TaxID=193462 RepID=UPI003648EBE5